MQRILRDYEREVDEEVDFMALGEELGKDSDLSQADYEEVLKGISAHVHNTTLAAIVDSCLEYRSFPPESFWQELILSARDWEVGGGLLSCLIPYVNLTTFVSQLLSKASTVPPSERRRISYTVWVATCGGSICVRTGDRFEMKETINRTELIREIERWMSAFTQPYDLDTLQQALTSLKER